MQKYTLITVVILYGGGNNTVNSALMQKYTLITVVILYGGITLLIASNAKMLNNVYYLW